MLDDVRLHAHLIGKPESRRELNTPVLVLETNAAIAVPAAPTAMPSV